uniref:DOG1 domain-containing protein n=1 Tax=Ananas comosus var. bracteatus TaxID=296719 RepID=A0A6V7PWA2_ANACO|nr:unnamed protein product [Ananas comosus var. bracteatus]
MGVRKERAWSLERSSYLTGTPSDSYDIDRIYYDTSSYYSASSVSVSISGLLGRKKSSSRLQGPLRRLGRRPPLPPPPLPPPRHLLRRLPRPPQRRRRRTTDPIPLPYDLLDSSVRSVHAHFEAHFDALDLAARHDPCQLLHPGPSLRSPLESPFLFLGGIHRGSSPRSSAPSSSTPAAARRGPSPSTSRGPTPAGRLLARLDQIERGLRLLVPTLLSRVREAQAAFVESAAPSGRRARTRTGRGTGPWRRWWRSSARRSRTRTGYGGACWGRWSRPWTCARARSSSRRFPSSWWDSETPTCLGTSNKPRSCPPRPSLIIQVLLLILPPLFRFPFPPLL